MDGENKTGSIVTAAADMNDEPMTKTEIFVAILKGIILLTSPIWGIYLVGSLFSLHKWFL